MTCLDEHQLRAFAAGTLQADELARAQAHVEGCASCHAATESLLLSTTAVRVDDPGGDALTAPSSRDPPAQQAVLAPGTVLGRFFVLEQVGSGGMGEVYSAYDSQLDRKVALKCLKVAQSSRTGDVLHERLVREARAMAKLAHPNVVSVFDVCVFDGQVFVTMELVSGQTLAMWLQATPRGWAEVLHVLIEAGRGLAAAHAVGLIHRDFKPANVMVADSGRVQVMDFGLAQYSFEPSAPQSAGPHAATLSPDATLPGFVSGTPAYTAPERHDGHTADARSDQYSFCVTLFEALYGQRPHRAQTYPELVQAMRSGAVVPAAEERKVPAWLRQVVLRGLSVDSSDRHASMDALLDELVRGATSHALRRTRWKAAAALAAFVGVTAATWEVLALRRGALCQGAAEHLSIVWNPQQKALVQAAFLKTGAPFAKATFQRIQQDLDAWAGRWEAAHRDACEATQLRGEQSEALMDLRMGCLDRRRRDLGALVRVFMGADGTVVTQAREAVFSLGSVDACADVEALAAQVAPPDTSQAREDVEAIRTRLADAQALYDAGKFKEALEGVKPLVARARVLEYRPLLAELLLLLGRTQERIGDDYAHAEQTLLESAQHAEASRHDEVAARALIELLTVTGGRRARSDEAEVWQTVATAAVDRIGQRGNLLGANLQHSIAAVLVRQGEYARALEHLQRALAIREQILGAEHPLVADALTKLGAALQLLGRGEETLAVTRRALEMRERLVGPDHPDVAESLNIMATRLRHDGRFAEAEGHFRRAVDIARASLGPDSAVLANYINNLAVALKKQERFDEAKRHYEEALDIRRRAFGPDHPDVANTHLNLGLLVLDRGDAMAALPHFRKALRIHERASGQDHPAYAVALLNLGEAHRALGEFDDAERCFRRALPIFEKISPDHVGVASTSAALGWILETGGRPREAMGHLQRASTLGAGKLDLINQVRVEFSLAKTQVANGVSRDGAFQRAIVARRRLPTGAEAETLRVQIDAWLRRHRARQVD